MAGAIMAQQSIQKYFSGVAIGISISVTFAMNFLQIIGIIALVIIGIFQIIGNDWYPHLSHVGHEFLQIKIEDFPI